MVDLVLDAGCHMLAPGERVRPTGRRGQVEQVEPRSAGFMPRRDANTRHWLRRSFRLRCADRLW